MSNTKKILIVGPAWVGDMVMAQTLFKLLKKNNPQAILDVMAPKATAPLLSRMPEVREGIVLPIGHGEVKLRQRFKVAKQCREQAYDQAIVLPNSFKSALVPFWANIPERTGWRGEMRVMLLNDRRNLDKAKYPLMIERFMALALPKGATLPEKPDMPAFAIDPADVENALAKLDLVRPSQPILALCPGAEFGPAKRWPGSHYGEVAKAKLQQGWQVWLFGGPKDRAAAAEIQSETQNGCVDLTGKTSLLDAIDLLSLATAVVSNDSGLMHVAAALQKPLVAVYGSSAPSFTPPLSDNAEILSLNLSCSPCFKRECPLEHLRCLKNLPPQQVLQAIDKLVPATKSVSEEAAAFSE